MTPAERKDAINIIRSFPKTITITIANLTDHQLDTPYGEGKWTIRQVVHHLADAQIKYQDELESLKSQMSMMENRVNEMKAAGEDKINELSDKVDTMWNEFKSNFEKIDTSVGQ